MPEELRWTQSGRIFLWRYCENTRNYPGWNLTADGEGCASLQELIDLFDGARWTCGQTIRLIRPNERVLCVPNNRGGKASWISRESLRLQYPKNKVPHEHWSLTFDQREVVLQLGARKLVDLRDGVSAIMNGRGDYAIGPDAESRFDEECLWFWGRPTGA